ncbi:MAG TPA: MFS transporter [Caulobacteraceae bacterium]|jgi:MFS family permease|nr:MFS transporter [Caulobacteraceae bacterium]
MSEELLGREALLAASEPSPAEGYALPGAWFTLTVMLCLTMFGFVDRQVITLVAAPMAASLRLTDGQIGAVQGLAITVFTLLVSYPAAWLADRVDRRLVVGLMILIWSIGTVACGFARSFHQLFAAAVLIAAGEAGLAPIGLSLVADLFTGRKRVLANSANYLAGLIGISAALILTGGLVAAITGARAGLPYPLREFEPWRLAFIAAALPAPIFFLLLPFARLRRPPATGQSGHPSNEALGAYLRAHGPGAVGVFLGLAIFSFSYGGFLVWLPVAAARLFGLSPAQNGLWMGGATAMGTLCGVAAGTLALRWLRPKLGARASIRLCWLAMLVAAPLTLAFALVGSAPELFGLVAVLMAIGTFIGCMVPNMLQDLAPGGIRSQVIAIYIIVTTLIAGSSPTVVGLLSGALGGPRSILYAIAISAAPAWVVACVVFRLVEHPYQRIVQAVGGGA